MSESVNCLISLYSDDFSLMAQISKEGEKLYIDFYKDEVLLSSLDVTDKSKEQALQIAENYVRKGS